MAAELLIDSEPPGAGLPELDREGRARVSAAKVLVAGAGALGSWSLLSLASAGIGTIGIVDGDVVEPRNLPHQVIHAPGQVGALKVDSAAEAVKTISPRVEVIPYRGRLDGANATEIVTGYDVVVDGLDNASARYALSDATARRAIPLVFAAVYEFEGQVSVLNAPDGPCYRCLHTAPPPPIVSPACTLVPAVIGGLQAIEAIKLVARVGRPLIGRLLIYDARESRFTELRFTREPACHICFARTEKS